MNPDDFEREPRSGNTQLHKLNPYLNHNNQKKKTYSQYLYLFPHNFCSIPRIPKP